MTTVIGLSDYDRLDWLIPMSGIAVRCEAFRVLANDAGVAKVAAGQLMQRLENHKLDARPDELRIMRIGRVTGSAYE